MDNDFLRGLRARYGDNNRSDNVGPDPLEGLLAKYRQFRTSSVIDGAAAATALSLDQLKAGNIDPLAAKAIHATNPHFDPLAWHSDAEWQAIVNAAKGKYFEYWVADQLNHGHAVGDLVLPSGYKAVVAESMNQPGWDLRIVDDNGHVQDYLQLKVTNSASYIHEALTRYPDIKILATSDVADHLDTNHMVINAGTTEDHLSNVIDASLDHHDSLLAGFWDHFHPIFPLIVIAGMQLHSVAVGKQSVRDAIEVANARGQRAFVTTSIGALAKILGLGWFSIPAALVAGYWFTGRQTIDQLVREMQERHHWLQLQGEWYRLRGLSK